MGLLFSYCHINGITHYVDFFNDWIHSISMILQRVMHVVVHFTKSYSMYCNLLSYLSVNEHLDCFQILAIANKDINMFRQLFVWRYVFISPWKIPWSITAETYVSGCLILKETVKLFSKVAVSL